jgi:CheY-like chemotaxis protein
MPDESTDPQLSRGARDERTLRVLLVDDDPLVGVTYTRLLYPCKVTFAQSATGALGRLQVGGKFDAILCDLQMPGMNGIEFHAEVAKLSPSLARQIIFVTASASSPEASVFFSRVANQRLTKPVAIAALKRAILAASPVAP